MLFAVFCIFFLFFIDNDLSDNSDSHYPGSDGEGRVYDWAQRGPVCEEEEAIEVTVQESSEQRAALSQTRQWEILTPGPARALDTGRGDPVPGGSLPHTATSRRAFSGLEKTKIRTEGG